MTTSPKDRNTPAPARERAATENVRDLPERPRPADAADDEVRGGQMLHDTAMSVIRKIGG